MENRNWVNRRLFSKRVPSSRKHGVAIGLIIIAIIAVLISIIIPWDIGNRAVTSSSSSPQLSQSEKVGLGPPVPDELYYGGQQLAPPQA